MSGSQRRRLLIGPGKKKGYYGFFLEKGWTWSKGRRRRVATGNTHSQAGPTEGTYRIQPHRQASVEAKAYAAGEAAFMAVIEAELDLMN